MPVTSDRFPSSTALNSSVDNPDNVFASDDIRATFNQLNDSAEWRGIAPFSIDSGMRIDGIEVVVECHYTGAGINRQMQVRVMNHADVGGSSTTKGQDVSSQNVDAEQTYGSSTDLWGLAIDPAYFDNSNLGVRISFTGFSVATVEIDSIKMRVYYSPIATDDRSARVKGSITVDAQRTGYIWAGYEHTHQESFDNTDNKDAGACQNVNWDTNGELKLQS